MRLFNRKKSIPETETRSDDFQNPIIGTLNYGTFSSYNQTKSLKLSTVYRCVNLISDSIAALPLLPFTFREKWKHIDYTNPLYNVLNVEPNSIMSAYTFKKLMVLNVLNKGNSYILINRQKSGPVISLTLLNSDYIQVLVNGNPLVSTTDITELLATSTAINITYQNILSQKVYDKSQIIHITNYPDTNGIKGISTLAYAATVLGIAFHTDNHSNNFFKGGANLGGILRPVAGVTLLKGAAIKAKQAFINALNPVLGGTSGGVVALDSGLEYQPIAINPKDSQMIENKAFNVLEICRFYGVPPSLAFSEGGKFNTAEQQSLDFMNNGLLPVIEKIENEMFRKLYLPSEWSTNELRFDVENLIRLDATTKAAVAVSLHSVGVKTTNEIRATYNSEFPVKGGNEAFISTNLQKLSNPVVQGDKVNNAAKPIKKEEEVESIKEEVVEPIKEEKIIEENK